jgi:hypothetical protein
MHLIPRRPLYHEFFRDSGNIIPGLASKTLQLFFMFHLMSLQLSFTRSRYSTVFFRSPSRFNVHQLSFLGQRLPSVVLCATYTFGYLAEILVKLQYSIFEQLDFIRFPFSTICTE